MAKDERKFRNHSFCMLEPSLIESDAFLSLSGKAAMLFVIRFHQKAHRKRMSKKKKGMKDMVITNNGEIIFTTAEARELGIKSSQTYHKIMHELVEDKGIIDIAEAGNWYEKRPTKFSISERWKRYGTKDYEKIEMPRILPEGLGFQKKKSKTRFDGSKSTAFDASK